MSAERKRTHSKDLHEQYNFRLGIHKVLKKVHPDTGINSVAINEINLIVQHVLCDIVDKANHLITQ